MMNSLIENISDKVKANNLNVEVSKIEDVLVLHDTNSISLPISAEWLTEKIEKEEDNEDILKNYEEISKYISEMKISDTAWAVTQDKFFGAKNFEACKKCMEHILLLDNPIDHGWINFIIFAERNREYDLAIKIAKEAFKRFKTPVNASLICFELGQFGNEEDLIKSVEDLLQLPLEGFNIRAVNYSITTAWFLLEAGNFSLAKNLLLKIISKHHNIDGIVNLAHCYMEESNKEEALKYYRKAKENNPHKTLNIFDEDRIALKKWITNPELWDAVRKELE